MSAYYNEIDSFAAAWLRELIGGGCIAAGDVDERSIKDVKGNDLKGYSQVHFFAGIGGWSHALRLARWPDARPVWTGSCPCQPFSVAGKGKGAEDERHLWPDFLRLIAECRPAIVFGEQVASADGRVWLAGIRADLEAVGYACGAGDLCTAGISAPHIRQRLYWLANAASFGSSQRDGDHRAESSARIGRGESGDNCWMGEPIQQGLEGYAGDGNHGDQPGWLGADAAGSTAEAGHAGWGDFFIPCADGKWRRVAAKEGEPEPELFPLAHGAPNRVGTLRGAGNAIVPPLAAEFVMAAMEAMQ